MDREARAILDLHVQLDELMVAQDRDHEQEVEKVRPLLHPLHHVYVAIRLYPKILLRMSHV